MSATSDDQAKSFENVDRVGMPFIDGMSLMNRPLLDV